MDWTHHAQRRASQRNVASADVALACEIGTHLQDGVYVRNADVDRAVADLKQRIAHIERLRRLWVAWPDDAIVTVYRPRRCRAARILRNPN
jgi:hypothetical protein